MHHAVPSDTFRALFSRSAQYKLTSWWYDIANPAIISELCVYWCSVDFVPLTQYFRYFISSWYRYFISCAVLYIIDASYSRLTWELPLVIRGLTIYSSVMPMMTGTPCVVDLHLETTVICHVSSSQLHNMTIVVCTVALYWLTVVVVVDYCSSAHISWTRSWTYLWITQFESGE